MVDKLIRKLTGSGSRKESRVSSKLPIKLADSEGLTHNISASGVFFELKKNHPKGSEIEFTIELQTPGGPLNLKCQGKVVRVEELDGGYGIAAKITAQEFQSLSAN